MLTQPAGSVYQVAYLVPDLDEAATRWAGVTGAGPFLAFEHFQFLDPVWLGKKTELDVSVALGFSAGLCVEFIQLHDQRPSIYRDWLEEHGFGLHHVAMLADDFAGTVDRHEAAGTPLVFSAGFGDGTRLAYLDARRQIGSYLEIVELTEFVRNALTGMRQLHDNWDGEKPLRPFAP